MAKKITEEDLRLNIVINGDGGRKALSDLRSTVDASTRKLSQLKSEMSKLEAQGKTSGKAYDSLKASITKETQALEANRQKLAALERQQSVNTMTLAELRKHINLTRTALSQAVPGTENWKKLNGELQQSRTRLKELEAQSKATEGAVKGMTNGWSDVWALGHMAIRGSKMVWGAITQTTDAFQEYDEVVTDAMKTTNLSKEEIMAMGEAFKKMDTRTAQNELMALLRIGGKLGISGQEDMMGFVEAADKINVALSEDLGGNAEAAIAAIGKMTDIFSLADEFGQGDAMLKIASAINSLGMASTANEGYMVDFTKRLAGIAPSADISIDKVLGLAATLDKYGQTAEVSSTSIGQTIVAMYKKTETFAEIAGMSFGEFKRLLDTDVNEALLRVVEGMKGAGDEGFAPIVAAMDGMGLNGQRAVTVLGTLAKNSEEVRAQQALANQAFTEGTSVIDEFNTKNNSAAATLEKTKKGIHDSVVEIGQRLMPVVQGVMDVAEFGVNALSTVIGLIAKYKVVLGLLLIVKYADIAATKIKNVLTSIDIKLMAQQLIGINGIRAATLLWVAAKKVLTLQIGASIKALKLFGKTLMAGTGPIGWAIAALTALAAGITHLITKSRASTKALRELNEQTINTTESYAEAESQIKKERDELDKLSTAATSAAQGTRERAAAIKAINDRYGDYLSALLTEKSSNEDIKTALMGVNDELERKVLLQAKEQELVKVQQHRTDAIKALLSDAETASNDNRDKGLHASEVKDITAAAAEYYDAVMTGSGDLVQLYMNLNASLRPAFQGAGWFGGKPETLVAEFGKAITAGRNLQAVVDGLFGDIPSGSGGALGSGGIGGGDDPGPTITTTTTTSTDAGLEDREKEKNDTLRKYSKDRYRILVEEELARYDLAVRNAGENQELLAAEERKHNAILGKLRLDHISERQSALEQGYKLELQALKNNQAEELATFEGNEMAKREMIQRYQAEEFALNREYAAKLNALLDEVVGKEYGLNIGLDEQTLTKINLALAQLKAKALELQNSDNSSDSGDSDNSGDSGDSGNSGKIWGKLSGGSALGLDDGAWAGLIDGIDSAQDLANAFTAIGNAAQAACQIAGKAFDVMADKEKKELKEFEKAQEKKQKAISDRVSAGLMTEAQYNAEVERMEAEKQAKQEELELKQAKRQKALSLVQAIINTAMSITSALATPPPASYVMAGINAAMGAAEIALIAAQPITTGYEEGGLTEIKREQDGKVFKVRLSPERGMISRPTALVGENGSEYVIPHDGVTNPALAPFLGTIERARRSGTLKSLDFNALYSPSYTLPGRAAGGFVADNVTVSSMPGNAGSGVDLNALATAVNRLNTLLSRPITAEVAMLGKKGIIYKTEEYNRLKKRGQL